MENILALVEQYINSKKKTWIPGKDLIHYSGPYFSAEEYTAAVESLLNGWLVLGDKCNKFENIFPRHFGKKYGILTNSGSSANLLMMVSLTSKRGYAFPKGTKVLVPIAGFPTTLNTILQVGFDPIFVDIELDTLNIDIEKTENLLKQHRDIKIITFAHVLGNPPNMTAIMDLVKQYNLILLEDCCDALDSTYDSKPLGSFGEMASCSFYPAHHITMGEGGFVACNTHMQETIVRSFREWGRGCYCIGPEANKLKCGTCKKRFSNWIPELPDEIFDHKYIYDEIGYNLKPIELQGAIGLVQLKKLPEIARLRKLNYRLLFDIYKNYEEYFYLPKAQPKSDPNWFAFPLTIKPTAPFTRADFVDYLEDNLIQTRLYFAGNIMLQPAYNHIIDSTNAKDNFPIATSVMRNTFFHGTSPVITEEQIAYIEKIIKNFFKSINTKGKK